MATIKSNSRTRRLRGWERWPRERLLEARICDLGLKVRGSPLAPRVRQLYDELKRAGLGFRPHVWLSDEWYSPEGVPGFAMPFFLAHPRLRRLEREMMLEVEGGERGWCMRLMRHETGHALLNAYKLHERRDWKRVFGRPSTPYPDIYLPRAYSKRFVLNLPNWYAQAHPDEDWAETFAVWMRPNFDWRRRYRGWGALKKLEYVDALMDELRGRAPRLRNRRETQPVERLRMTLGAYYEDKLARYQENTPDFFDRDLRRLFSESEEHARNERASRCIRRLRHDIIDVVERWSGEYKYRINYVLNDMIKRCDALGLRVARPDTEMRTDLCACVTMLVMHKLYSGGFHLSL